MLCMQPGWLPSLVALAMATGAVTVYVIAVLKGDVTPYVPFISEAGGHAPESGVFALFLITAAITSLVTLYVRYSIVKQLLDESSASWREMMANVVGLVLGVGSVMGMVVVAAFPVFSVSWVHNVGSYGLFLFGICYCFFQTYLSYRLHPEFSGLCVCHLRLTLSFLGLAFLVIMVVFYVLAEMTWNPLVSGKPKELRIPGDKGFELYLVSAAAEWGMAACFIFFFFTFVREFQKVAVSFSSRLLVKHLDEEVSLRRVWGQSSDHDTEPLWIT